MKKHLIKVARFIRELAQKIRFRNLNSVFAITTHMTVRERIQLYKLVSNNKSIAEIGSFVGTSACCFGAGLKERGDHSYSGVKADWDAYKSFLKPGSIVIFHDYGWAEGVKRVIHEDVMPFFASYDNLPNMWWATLSKAP